MSCGSLCDVLRPEFCCAEKRTHTLGCALVSFDPKRTLGPRGELDFSRTPSATGTLRIATPISAVFSTQRLDFRTTRPSKILATNSVRFGPRAVEYLASEMRVFRAKWALLTQEANHQKRVARPNGLAWPFSPVAMESVRFPVSSSYPLPHLNHRCIRILRHVTSRASLTD
jgi:hypothetical protein